MTTRHSLFTRGLSLVLALVMVLGNLSGLTMETRAAEGNLFELLAANEQSASKELAAVLQNADALPELAAMNTVVAVEEAPEEAEGYFYEGNLKVKAIGNWLPAYYNVSGKKVAFEGEAQTDKADFVGITYKLPLNAEENVKAIYDYVAELGGVALAQKDLLNSVSTLKSLTALELMDGGYNDKYGKGFVEQMLEAVEKLQLSDVGFELPTVEEIKAEIRLEDLVEVDYNVDINEDGVIDEADKEQIIAELWADAEVQAKLDAKIAEKLAEAEAEVKAEFAQTKADYINVIKKMYDHLLLDDQSEFYLSDDYLDRKGNYVYEYMLRIYAMLAEYDEVGLRHYYEHANEIHAELKAMAAVLEEILGEKQADGTYANAEIIDFMLKDMGYANDVTIDHLAEMAVRMKAAGEKLPIYASYINEIALADAETVDALFFAKNQEDLPLICQVKVAGLDPVIYAYSEEVIMYADEEIVHNIVKVDAVEPGCHYTGNVEHWYCTECDTVWADEALTQVTNHKNVIIPALGGEVVAFEAVEPGCHDNGCIAHWICYTCEQVWQDAALTQLTNIKNVTVPALGGEVVHVEAVAPTATENGNIEYWYCESCEKVWQDAALTQLTNIKNVILPAGMETECKHAEVIHMEAIEPGCHYEGQQEHWYCADCDIVWADEAQTQVTNHKNVIIPELGGEVIHVEAKEPTETEDGNIEYWYCESCEQVWADEAMTQLTNIKNVILPAVEIVGDTAENPIMVEFAMNEAWTEGTATISVPTGTWYYGAYISGMVLTANGEFVEVIFNGPRMPGIFSFTNEGAEPVVYELHVSFPVGTNENPAELVMGENVAEIAADSWTGYVFGWTAPKNGTLVFTMPEADWSYVINNMGKPDDWSDDQYGDTQWSDSEPANPAFIKVKAGDQLQIMVNTYDPANPWSTPAGTLVINAELKGEKANITFAPVGGSVVSAKQYQVGYVLTEADVAAHLDKIKENAENRYAAVDEEAFLNTYVGYQVIDNAKFEYELVPNKYEVTVNGEKLEASANFDGKNYYITLAELGFEDGIIYTVEVDGEELLVKSIHDPITIDIETLAAGKLIVNKLEKALESLVEQLNAANAGVYEIKDGALVAHISLGQLSAFGNGVFNAKFDITGDGAADANAYIDVQLNGERFIFAEGALKVSIPAVVNALLHDEAFTSENLIAISNADGGELLHATMKTPLFEVPFVIDLTSTPSKMDTAAKGLNKIKSVMTFEAHEGHLNIDLEIPEKVYEAYLAVALVTGQYSKTNTAELNNKIGLDFLNDYFQVIQNDQGVTAATYNNTLAMLGVDKSLTGKYAEACDLIHAFIQNADKFSITTGEKKSDLVINAENTDIDGFLALIGTSMKDLAGGKDIFADEPIDTLSYVNITNVIPAFDAAVFDPFRIVNKNFVLQDVLDQDMDGVKDDLSEIKDKNFGAAINGETTKGEKAMFANMTTNLSAQLSEVYGASAIMLLNDVGSLDFQHAAILDLNGHNVNGSISTDSKLIIIDSTLNTVSGATVTGSVTGDVTVLAGIYNADVSAFLKDGYYQDEAGAVKNAMFEIGNGRLSVNPAVYVDNVDGYLPAVHYLAAEIAVDFALNYYTAAALYTDGKTATGATNCVYDIDIENLIGMLGKDNLGYAFDEVLSCINTAEMSDFANKILADLVNVDKIAHGLETGETISTYKFAIHPWALNFEHVDEGDYLTVGVTANEALAKTVSLPLGLMIDTGYVIEIPKTDRSYTVQEILDELSTIVVTVDDDAVDGTNVEIMIDQPYREGKNLIVGGDATATINLDFSHNGTYNRVLAAALAYFDETLTKDLVKNGCIVELNEAMAKITVGQLFDVINQVVQNKEVPFEKIAAKLELDLTDSQLEKLCEGYDKFQSGVAKIMAKFDLTKIAKTPLSDLVDNDGLLVFDADINNHYADAFYRGFGVKAELNYSKAKLIVNFNNEHVPGDPVREYICNCTYDLVVYCELCGVELSRERVNGLWGDVNCDNLIDARDAAWIAKYEVGLASEEDMDHFERADVNADGIVDARDAAWIAKHEVGIVQYEDFPAVKAENA